MCLKTDKVETWSQAEEEEQNQGEEIPGKDLDPRGIFTPVIHQVLMWSFGESIRLT